MRKQTQRRGRQFPPQISKDELLKRTQQELTKKGVDNVCESKYINEISLEVVGYDDPIFYSLQPEIKLRDNKAWQLSYSIILRYLEDMKMEETLRSISIELEGQELNTLNFDGTSNEYLTKLLQISRRLSRKSFSTKVAEFTKKYTNRRYGKINRYSSEKNRSPDYSNTTPANKNSKNLFTPSSDIISPDEDSPKSIPSSAKRKDTPKANSTSINQTTPKNTISPRREPVEVTPVRNNVSFQDNPFSEEYSDNQTSPTKKTSITKKFSPMKKISPNTKAVVPSQNINKSGTGWDSTPFQSEHIQEGSIGANTIENEHQSNVIDEEIALSFDDSPKKGSVKSSKEFESSSIEEVQSIVEDIQSGSNLNEDDVFADIDFEE